MLDKELALSYTLCVAPACLIVLIVGNIVAWQKSTLTDAAPENSVGIVRFCVSRFAARPEQKLLRD